MLLGCFIEGLFFLFSASCQCVTRGAKRPSQSMEISTAAVVRTAAKAAKVTSPIAQIAH